MSVETRLDYTPIHAPDLRRADWQAFAKEVGLSGASTVTRVEELAGLVSRSSGEVARQIAAKAGDQTRVLERILRSVQKRCSRILAQPCG